MERQIRAACAFSRLAPAICQIPSQRWRSHVDNCVSEVQIGNRRQFAARRWDKLAACRASFSWTILPANFLAVIIQDNLRG